MKHPFKRKPVHHQSSFSQMSSPNFVFLLTEFLSFYFTLMQHTATCNTWKWQHSLPPFQISSVSSTTITTMSFYFDWHVSENSTCWESFRYPGYPDITGTDNSLQSSTSPSFTCSNSEEDRSWQKIKLKFGWLVGFIMHIGIPTVLML